MLTDTKIRNEKPGDKPRKVFDGRGLYLLITPQGGRHWRLKYYFERKERLLALGSYPGVTLKMARDRAAAARVQLSNDIDPGAERRAARAPVAVAEGATFGDLALDWHSRHTANYNRKHAAAILRRLQVYILPRLAARPITEITAPELLEVLRAVEERSAGVAHRLHQYCSRIFRYGIATGRVERDPAADLRGALSPVAEESHHAAVTAPLEVGALMRAIEGYAGSHVVRCALRLSALTFVRPGELRRAEWSEINFTDATWRIPASKMKMRLEHVVPLSTQAVAVLRELHPLTGGGRHVFTGAWNPGRPMSGVAVLAALRRMGYSTDEMTAHGFRTTACTLLNEMGWPSDVIERQLAHVEQNQVRAAYNRAEHLPERRKMMQVWADYLDQLTHGRRDGVSLNIAEA